MLMSSHIYTIGSTPCGVFSSNQKGIIEYQVTRYHVDGDTRYRKTGELLGSLLRWLPMSTFHY